MANTLGLSHWTVVQNGARKITCMLVEPPWLLLTGLSLLPIALREYKKQTTKQTKWLRDAKLFWTFLTISNSAIVFAEQLKPNIFLWFFQFWGPIVAIFFGKSLENYYHRQKMLVFKLTIMMRLFLLDHRGRLFCNVCRPSLTIIPMVVNRRSNYAMLTMHRWSLQTNYDKPCEQNVKENTIIQIIYKLLFPKAVRHCYSWQLPSVMNWHGQRVFWYEGCLNSFWELKLVHWLWLRVWASQSGIKNWPQKTTSLCFLASLTSAVTRTALTQTG